MTKTTELVAAVDDPQPGLHWEVIYRDTFDRECPPSVEVEGQGLVRGLAELWARFVFETIQLASTNRDGRLEQVPTRGFSEFSLQGTDLRVILDGSLAGGHKLKTWMFDQPSASGIVADANASLLQLLADTHARAAAFEDAASAILDVAEAATDRADFEARLRKLRESWV
ncbi:MAG: hypothetical protein H0V17_01955 [Deltaproteobacteria bacterium]|nr:hypothetical protein [Deltaproteobacteria bacterium]